MGDVLKRRVVAENNKRNSKMQMTAIFRTRSIRILLSALTAGRDLDYLEYGQTRKPGIAKFRKLVQRAQKRS